MYVLNHIFQRTCKYTTIYEANSNSGTAEVSIHAATVDGQKCYLVDTPGFDDTNRPDSEILREVANWLNLSHEADIPLAGIVYLHRISDNRLGGAAMKNLRMFKRLCGKRSLPSVVLATTMWSKSNRSQDEQRERELLDNPKFWGDMVNDGSKVLRHDNGRESATAIMKHILGNGSRVTLEIQKEMANGATLDETGAGQEVQSDIAALREKYEKELNSLRQELQEARDALDYRAIEEINELRAEAMDKIRRGEDARRGLQVDRDTLRTQREEEMRLLYERELDHRSEMENIRMQLMAATLSREADAQNQQLQWQLAHLEAKKRNRCNIM